MVVVSGVVLQRIKSTSSWTVHSTCTICCFLLGHWKTQIFVARDTGMVCDILIVWYNRKLRTSLCLWGVFFFFSETNPPGGELTYIPRGGSIFFPTLPPGGKFLGGFAKKWWWSTHTTHHTQSSSEPVKVYEQAFHQ